MCASNVVIAINRQIHTYTMSFRAKSRNPRGRDENNRTRPTQILARRGSLPRQPNARGGSPPSVAGATVSASARFSRYGYAYAQNDNLSGRARRLIRISIIKTKRTPVPPCHCERSVAISRKGNVGNAPAPAKCPRRLTAAPRRLAATIRIIQYFF